MNEQRKKELLKINKFILAKNNKPIEKLLLKVAIRLPLFSSILLFLSIFIMHIPLMLFLSIQVATHLFSVFYLMLRRNLHYKNILRCDWIL